jgi:hypothetical protein
VPACPELLRFSIGWGQDECREKLTNEDRSHLLDGRYSCRTAPQVEEQKRETRQASLACYWQRLREQEERRILTATSDPVARKEYCRFWARDYPGDHDNACPASLPPPKPSSRRRATCRWNRERGRHQFL